MANAARRIQKELRDLKKDSTDDVVTEGENMNHWKISIKGPTNSPFAGGVFQLSVNFPSEYPFKPPKVMFKTQVYHPNINNDGSICVDVLKEQWSPALTISKVLAAISELLSKPNPDDPLVAEIADLYRSNKAKYEKTAREWTLKYASR